MTQTNETTAYTAAFSAQEDGAPAASAKRTDRPATAIFQRAEISAALEARPIDARLVDEVARKIQTPLTNLGGLFEMITDDLDALPIVVSEMVWSIKAQMSDIEAAVEGLNGQTLAESAGSENGQVAADALADRVFAAVRAIRTPVANMEGLLSLVLDDTSVLPAPVAEMLRVAFEQLEKLARVIDEVSETANVFKGKIDVRSQTAALDTIVAGAIAHAQEEGFDGELVHSSQVSAGALPEIGATAGQCLEALIRHALLDTVNFQNDLPVGLFLYSTVTAAGEDALVIELHDDCARAEATGVPQNTLDQQIVYEMTMALGGRCSQAAEPAGKMILHVTIPFASLASDLPTDAPAEPAVSNAYQGLAILPADHHLSRVIEEAVQHRLMIKRVDSFAAMMEQVNAAYLPTVFISADLLKNVSGEQLQELEAATHRAGAVFVLEHGEADVGSAAALFPVLWDDDLLAIAGMLEQPFQPGVQQENLILITGDNSSEVRPWRKLLSSTGHGSLWWPAARAIPAERFPTMIGGVVVVAESSRALPPATWNALSDLRVRDRRIIVLTGPGSCQLPRARGWDVYRPNLNVCDDTLRRYILFNAPTQQTPRVAVIEDDILMRKLLVSTIEDQARIVEMGSVQEALANLRTMAFDVILLDLFLPDGSGVEILKAIQNDPCLTKAANTPVIALTGSSDLELNQAARDAGACEVLVKPVPMQVLRQKIALLTRENRSRRITGATETAATTTTPAPGKTNASAHDSRADLPVVPLKPHAPGMSKIINLRALKAAGQTRTPIAAACGVGD